MFVESVCNVEQRLWDGGYGACSAVEDGEVGIYIFRLNQTQKDSASVTLIQQQQREA